MQRKLIKMGKRTAKTSAVRKLETNGKNPLLYVRDSFPDESNDSGLGSDTFPGLLDSNSLSSCLEESDLDCWSSDSVDSGISEHSRLARCKRQRTIGHVSQATLHVDSSLALSLNRKMHIQHARSDNNPKISSFDEPSPKWRRLTPGADKASLGGEGLTSKNNSLNSARNTLLQRFPLTSSPGLLNNSVLSDAFHSGNATGNSLRNDFENRDSAVGKDGNECAGKDGFALKGAPDQNSRNGDRIAALLSSSSSNSLVRKRPVKKPSLHVCFPSRSKDGKVELCILIQPEEQHRARYMTEGSRGSIKDEKGTGFPTVKLVGYNQPVVLQIFIGSDQGKIQPHLFYQACKVSGKNCTPCSERIIDGTCVIEINMTPDSDMTVSCDCIGILKERNVDVEQRLPYFGLARCKKRSTKCRMVFRVNIPLSNGNFETLQTASSQILCTQSPGLPEICKKSLTESPMTGGSELFIIGKNFQKDAKIVFQQLADEQREPGSGKDAVVWEEAVDPEKEYAHQSHLVCAVPPYRNPDVLHPVKVFLSVLSGGKSSEPHTFTYTPPHAVQKEKFVHSPMRQARNSPVPLDINHQFSKSGMDSPNPNMSPVMLATGNSDSSLRNMLSPSVFMNGGCAGSPRQLSALSIQLMSPSSSTAHSPLSTSGMVNPLESSSIGNLFNTTESVGMTSLMSNGSMIIGNSANGHLSSVSSLDQSLPSSPSQRNLTSMISNDCSSMMLSSSSNGHLSSGASSSDPSSPTCNNIASNMHLTSMLSNDCNPMMNSSMNGHRSSGVPSNESTPSHNANVVNIQLTSMMSNDCNSILINNSTNAHLSSGASSRDPSSLTCNNIASNMHLTSMLSNDCNPMMMNSSTNRHLSSGVPSNESSPPSHTDNVANMQMTSMMSNDCNSILIVNSANGHLSSGVSSSESSSTQTTIAPNMQMTSLMSNDCNSMLMSNSTNGQLSSAVSSRGSSLSLHTISSNLQIGVHEPPKHISGMTSHGEDHHDVDLMSGINQLATEMVRAQEDAASSRVVQMSTSVMNRVTDLNNPTSATGFVQNCLGMMAVSMVPASLVSQQHSSATNSSAPSQDILHQGNLSMVGHMQTPLLAKIEPLPIMEGMDQGRIMPETSSAAAFESMDMPICPASLGLNSGETNCQLTVANLHQAGDSSLVDVKPSLLPSVCLDAAANVQLRQTMDAAFSTLSSQQPSDSLRPLTATQSLPNLIDIKVDPLVYTTACGATNTTTTTVVYDALAGSQSNHATVPREVANFGISAGAVESKPAANDLVLAPNAVKTEKPEQAPDSLSNYQQSMTSAFSMMSDTALEAIINPEAFNAV